MGSTHSSSSSFCSSSDVGTTKTATGSTPTTTFSNCICCLAPRPNFGQLLAKLKRTLLRHLRPSSLKRRNAFQRGCGARTALLRPMPRCSSFGSCSTLIRTTPSSKHEKSSAKKNQINSTDNYAQWKCMFERAASKKTRCPPATQRPHDISEALSGQTTPRGFPSHTDARRCVQQTFGPKRPDKPEQSEQSEQPEQPIYDCVGEEKKISRRLSLRLPSGSNQGSVRRLTARQRAAQAHLEEQLQRELCDLEEYYGGFYYARRNDRRI